MSTKIYKVITANGGIPPTITYMVRAKSRAQATAFIASSTITAALPTQDELIEHAAAARPILDAVTPAVVQETSNGE